MLLPHLGPTLVWDAANHNASRSSWTLGIAQSVRPVMISRSARLAAVQQITRHIVDLNGQRAQPYRYCAGCSRADLSLASLVAQGDLRGASTPGVTVIRKGRHSGIRPSSFVAIDSDDGSTPLSLVFA
jgi:hypothetical protein